MTFRYNVPGVIEKGSMGFNKELMSFLPYSIFKFPWIKSIFVNKLGGCNLFSSKSKQTRSFSDFRPDTRMKSSDSLSNGDWDM